MCIRKSISHFIRLVYMGVVMCCVQIDQDILAHAAIVNLRLVRAHLLWGFQCIGVGVLCRSCRSRLEVLCRVMA